MELLGGRSDIMALYETRTRKLSYSGTFNNNVFTISAALAAIDLVSEDEIHRVNKLGDTIRNKISEICAAHHLSDLRITGFGSAIGLQFLRVDRDLPKGLFFYHMLQHGIFIGRRGFLFLNMCHTEDHVQRFLTAFQKFVEEFKKKKFCLRSIAMIGKLKHCFAIVHAFCCWVHKVLKEACTHDYGL